MMTWHDECVWCAGESSLCVELCAVLMSSLVIRVHVVSRITLNAVQCWKLLLTVSMCVCAACCCCQTSDEQVVKPVVSVYPAASRAHLEGRSSLLCVASAMFPPRVKFSWIRQKEDQDQWFPAKGEQLELRESGCIATILPLDRDALDTYKYRCSVQHEGGTVQGRTEQGNECDVLKKERKNHLTWPWLWPRGGWVKISIHQCIAIYFFPIQYRFRKSSEFIQASSGPRPPAVPHRTPLGPRLQRPGLACDLARGSEGDAPRKHHRRCGGG